MVEVKFDRLVHPLRDALVNEDQVKAILPSQLIRHQASGVSVGRSAAWKLDVLINAGKDPEATGTSGNSMPSSRPILTC